MSKMIDDRWSINLTDVGKAVRKAVCLVLYNSLFGFAFSLINYELYTIICNICASNGGHRRKEKGCKHWPVSTKPLSSVTATFFFFFL